MFAGLLGAGVSGLISGLFHQNDRQNIDKELQKRQDDFRAQIESMRTEATQQGEQLNTLAQQRFNTNPIGEISGIVNSYKASDWNKYLQQEAAQSVEGLAADQGLLSSPRGMQMIQNESALAASQGMSDYVKESLQRRSDLDRQGLSLMDMRNSTLNSYRNSAMSGYQSMFNKYADFITNRDDQNSKANVFDSATNYFAGSFAKSITDRYNTNSMFNSETTSSGKATSTRASATTAPKNTLPSIQPSSSTSNKNQGLAHLFGPIYYKP